MNPTNPAMRRDPDLDYRFRNVFNLYADGENVTIEFGTQHRPEGDFTVYDRLVLPYSVAIQLQGVLTKKLQEVQQQVRQEAARQVQANRKE